MVWLKTTTDLFSSSNKSLCIFLASCVTNERIQYDTKCNHEPTAAAWQLKLHGEIHYLKCLACSRICVFVGMNEKWQFAKRNLRTVFENHLQIGIQLQRATQVMVNSLQKNQHDGTWRSSSVADGSTSKTRNGSRFCKNTRSSASLCCSWWWLKSQRKNCSSTLETNLRHVWQKWRQQILLFSSQLHFYYGRSSCGLSGFGLSSGHCWRSRHRCTLKRITT